MLLVARGPTWWKAVVQDNCITSLHCD